MRRQLLLGIMLAMLLPPAADARDRVSLHIGETASAGNSVPFTWSAHSRGTVVIQKPEGTARVWRTIDRLSSHGGSGDLSPFAIGIYHIRIAALKGRHLYAQQQALLRVYGQVPFSVLLHKNESKTVDTPTNTFDYLSEGGENSPFLQVTNNSCTSVHVEWVSHFDGFRPNKLDPSFQATLSVIQEDLEPQSATAPAETIGALDARLDGKSWSLRGVNNGSHEFELHFYVNGFAICDSTAEFEMNT